jgi:hypothetical protein
MAIMAITGMATTITDTAITTTGIAIIITMFTAAGSGPTTARSISAAAID